MVSLLTGLFMCEITQNYKKQSRRILEEYWTIIQECSIEAEKADVVTRGCLVSWEGSVNKN